MRNSPVAVLLAAAVIISSVSTRHLFPRTSEGEEGNGLAQFGALDDLMWRGPRRKVER